MRGEEGCRNSPRSNDLIVEDVFSRDVIAIPGHDGEIFRSKT